jgi:sialate O-acetylesterase
MGKVFFSKLFVIFLLTTVTNLVASEKALSCPSFFSSNMVLQGNAKVPIWGKGRKNAKVLVQFAGQTKNGVVNDKGIWKIYLDKLKPSTKGKMLIISSGEEVLEFNNVLVGELWVASGQSNMEWTLTQSNMPRPQLAKLNRQTIRVITIAREASKIPKFNSTGKWEALNSSVGARSSAVACYFAMKLQDELKVPIGIISTSFSSTRIEPWISAEGFKKVKGFEAYAKLVENLAGYDDKKNTSFPPFNQKIPGALYNGMIAPVVGMAIKGVIWYQGESNVGDGKLYEKKMQALVGGWRENWGIGNFPFYYVQIAPYGNYSGEKLGEIWDAQRSVMNSVSNTGMAVTTDIGVFNDIHPRNKADVGKRLALWALAKDYGKDIVYSGPLYKKHEFKENTMVIHFDHAQSGLAVKGKTLNDFKVKGVGDKAFVNANVKTSGPTLIVTHPQGKKPLHVRMGWTRFSIPNLINKNGLPASPFKTGE